MEKLLNAIADLIGRLTARSFMLSTLVIYLVVTRPDMTLEQIVALLGALGFVTVRAVAEDKAPTLPPMGSEMAPEDPTK